MKHFFTYLKTELKLSVRDMNGKMIIIAVTIAMLSFSLSACGKLPSSNKDGQNTSNIENSLESVEIIPSTDTGISSGEDTSEDKNTLINENTATEKEKKE